MCLLGVMDRLWFNQIILFPESSSLLSPKSIKTPEPSSESLPTSTNTSQLLLSDQETSSELSSITHPQDDSNYEEENDEEKARPTRISLKKTKLRSHSFSPSIQKNTKDTLRYSSSMEGLQNINMARCRSLCELELEEVKGFMDLGFIFKKDNISPKMMSLVPGLQRLNDEATDKDDDIEEEDEDENEEKSRGIMRPYLSEAWLIKRPDSPLLNLKVPRDYAAANMKKHLRFWARTVASEIQQES